MLPSAPWTERRRALRDLFETIAPSYDRLNHLLSLGIDRRWRRATAREALREAPPGPVLDLASGTGDLAVALRRQDGARMIVRLDLSESLLRIAVPKLREVERDRPQQAGAPAVVAEMERIPLRPGSCAAVTMGFALRHIQSLPSLLHACAIVLAPGGRVAFVDMSLPRSGAWGIAYRLYFRKILPRAARLFGGDRAAYEAMVRSVETFPGWDALATAAREAGFVDVRSIPWTGDAARLFLATKSR
ncbi:MAG: class I SAM-dependent methyltransferase [Candidatus Eisenbacteria bacterium]|nr:class I SAM-dependent methyltransferase [Candidatus Eisenbacteria bacterium]